MLRISSGSSFQSFVPATLKERSPNDRKDFSMYKWTKKTKNCEKNDDTTRQNFIKTPNSCRRKSYQPPRMILPILKLNKFD